MREIPNLSQKSGLFTLAVTLVLAVGAMLLFGREALIPSLVILVGGTIAAGFLLGKGELDDEVQQFVLVIPGIFSSILLWALLLGFFGIAWSHLRPAIRFPVHESVYLAAVGGIAALPVWLLARRSRADGHTRRRYLGRLLKLLLGVGLAIWMVAAVLEWTLVDPDDQFQHADWSLFEMASLFGGITLVPVLLLLGVDRLLYGQA